MKLKNLLLAAVFIAISLTAKAQTDVKINPIGLLFGSPDISAEFGAGESIGIEPLVGATFRNFKLGDVSYKSNGFRVGVIGKYYFNPEKGMDGFWGGLYLRGGGSNSKTTEANSASTVEFSNSRLALGLALGYKWVSRKNIVFGIDAGGGRALLNEYKFETGSTNLNDIPFANIDILFRIAVGYRFGGDTGSSKSKKKK